ncbi:MAG: PRC-barrel domain-containing protein [Nitrospirales bacterium]
MLRALLEMQGYRLRAIDKDCGTVVDFYFDDRLWTLRYVVADTGNWLPGRKVLIAPEAIEHPNWEERVFPVTLTSTAIEESPGLESDLPFSLQKEKELRTFFKWREYWNDEIFLQPLGYTLAGAPGVTFDERHTESGLQSSARVTGNPHLRSAQEVKGYSIRAHDGEIGQVKDFIVVEGTWAIRYLVIDTENWLPGKKVIISPTWVNAIDWSHQRVDVGMTQEMIERSPEFTPDQPIDKEYEIRLYDYYGKPHDWD